MNHIYYLLLTSTNARDFFYLFIHIMLFVYPPAHFLHRFPPRKGSYSSTQNKTCIILLSSFGNLLKVLNLPSVRNYWIVKIILYCIIFLSKVKYVCSIFIFFWKSQTIKSFFCAKMIKWSVKVANLHSNNVRQYEVMHRDNQHRGKTVNKCNTAFLREYLSDLLYLGRIIVNIIFKY